MQHIDSPAKHSRYVNLRRLLLWAPSLLLFVAWAILYLPNLRTNPGWYGDETQTVLAGKEMLKGVFADRAIFTTFLHPAYNYQPGFAFLVGIATKLAHGDIFGARCFCVLLALICSLIIYFSGRSHFGVLPALTGAMIFLGYEQTVIHFRWVYPHNMVALGFLYAAMQCLRPSRRGTDWKCGVGLALAAFSHLLFVHGTLAAFLCRICHPRSWFRLFLPPALAIGISLGVVAFAHKGIRWSLDDLHYLSSFYASYSAENGKGKILSNFINFFTHDGFHILAFVAILLCINRRYFTIAIWCFVVSFLLLQNRQNLPLFYYQAIVFLPLLCVAIAAAFDRISTWLRKTQIGKTANIFRFFQFAVLILVILWSTRSAAKSLQGTLVPRNQFWVTQSTEEVTAAAQWLNTQTQKDDLVICNQNIAWLLNARTTDYLQVAAWNGIPTCYYEKPMPHERFRYPADLSKAHFAIVGDIDQRWTFSQPGIPGFFPQLKQWPLVWSGDNYYILENPAWVSKEKAEVKKP